jgi:NAD(P)H-binding
MTESPVEKRKPIPRQVLIFGAADRIGGPLAEFLGREASSTRLRLSTSNAAKVPSLRASFPMADVVVADYREVGSLKAAVQGVDGVFVLTPSGTDERITMTNLVMALKTVDNIVQVIRLVGMQPEANARLIPQFLREHGLGLPIQHPIAKQILDDSGLPVTYLNCGACLMDNFSVGWRRVCVSVGRLSGRKRSFPTSLQKRLGRSPIADGREQKNSM